MLSTKLKLLIAAVVLTDFTATAVLLQTIGSDREQVRCRAQVAELNYSVNDTIAICSGEKIEVK